MFPVELGESGLAMIGEGMVRLFKYVGVRCNDGSSIDGAENWRKLSARDSADEDGGDGERCTEGPGSAPGLDEVASLLPVLA